METLSPNVQEIVHFLNWFLIYTQMVALYVGVHKFRNVPLVGSWFRWKAFGYTLLIFVADLVALYFLWEGHPLFALVRLAGARVVHLWETLYCFYYRFNRLPEFVKIALTEPWHLNPAMPPYESVWRKLLRHMRLLLQRRRGKHGVQCSREPHS